MVHCGRRAVPADRVTARPRSGPRVSSSQLLELAARLSTRRPVMPRGVLLVERLVHDGTGAALRTATHARVRASSRGHAASTGRRSMVSATELEPRSARLKRVARRPADGHRPDGGDAAPEVARAADLRVRPALVGGVRDRGGARRARRGLGGRRAPGRSRSRSAIAVAARDRRALVSPDGSRLRELGGAYIVAKENLGTLPSLVAAAALLTDYVLTVAVSVPAGVLALTSAVTRCGVTS